MSEIDHIEVSATKEFECRETRLHRVLGYVAACDNVNNSKALQKLAGIHDHKGTLKVSWNEEPTDVERRILVDAWASDIGDGGTEVEHSQVS